jgi:hypothetical protein
MAILTHTNSEEDFELIPAPVPNETIETPRLSEARPDGSNPTATNIDDARKVGAGVVATVICLPFFGIFLSGVAGFAAAYGTTQDGAGGDICRAAGDVALTARQKAVEVNNKHHLVDKTKEEANKLLMSAKDLEQRHQILSKIRIVLIETLKNIGEVCKVVGEEFRKSRERSQRGEYQDIPHENNQGF